MKNVSRSSSNKLSSCFRPEADFDPPSPSLHRSSSFRWPCLPLPPKHHHPSPKPTFSLLIKALAIHTRPHKEARLLSRQGSKRRSSSDERTTVLNQAAKSPHTPETKAERPRSCWSPGSESENSSKSSHSNKPDDGESRHGYKEEKQKKSEWLGMFMLVFSLTLTVMVGKYWGALLTSTWLYLFSLAKAGKLKAKLSGRQVQVKRNRSVGEGWMVGS